MFKQSELSILVQALEVLPVNTSVKDLRSGNVKINPVIEQLIIKLKNMQDEEIVETGSEAVEEAVVEEVAAPEAE